jgi:glutamate transport system substrate-binding protein
MSVVGLSAIMALAACGSSGGSSSSDASASPKVSLPAGSTMARIAKAGTLRAGIELDAPGFSQKNLNGQYAGMDPDVVRMIAKALGIPDNKIQWTETVTTNREAFLEQNKVDVIVASYGITPARQKVVTFAGPYASSYYTLLVLKGNPHKIDTWSDTNGKEICGIAGGAAQTALQAAAPKVKYIGFDTGAKCVTALLNGQVDGYINAVTALSGAQSQDPNSLELLRSLKVGSTIDGIGIHKGEIDFCNFIDRVLTNAYKSGEYQSDWNATLGKLIDEPPSPLHFIKCQ